MQALDRVTRLEVFQEFVRGLEEQERQEREKEKEAKRRQERRNRDSFRQLLQQHRCEDCKIYFTKVLVTLSISTIQYR